MLILDKFFLKYEEGVGVKLTPLPQKKLPSKSPALLGLKVFSYEFCEIFKSTFFHRTPLVAASGKSTKDPEMWPVTLLKIQLVA